MCGKRKRKEPKNMREAKTQKCEKNMFCARMRREKKEREKREQEKKKKERQSECLMVCVVHWLMLFLMMKYIKKAKKQRGKNGEVRQVTLIRGARLSAPPVHMTIDHQSCTSRGARLNRCTRVTEESKLHSVNNDVRKATDTRPGGETMRG
jgi:uncharacterized Rmd1/YagE family protein